MTFRLPMFLAASLFLASHAAYAMPTPASTDEARALAASMRPAPSTRSAAPTSRVATTTDEARALAREPLPSPSPRPAAPAFRVATTTDEARALGASTLR